MRWKGGGGGEWAIGEEEGKGEWEEKRKGEGRRKGREEGKKGGRRMSNQ